MSSIKLSRKLPNTIFSPNTKIPGILSTRPPTPDKNLQLMNIDDLDQQKEYNILKIRTYRRERQADEIEKYMESVKNKAHLDNVNVTIKKINTGLKHLGKDLDSETLNGIQSQCTLLRNQRADLKEQIVAYTDGQKKTAKGGSSYEGYINSPHYKKIISVQQLNSEIDRKVKYVKNDFDKAVNFKVMYDRTARKIDDLNSGKNALYMQIENDKSIHEKKQQEIKDRLDAEQLSRNKRIERGLIRVKLKDDHENALREDYDFFNVKRNENIDELKRQLNDDQVRDNIDTFKKYVEESTYEMSKLTDSVATVRYDYAGSAITRVTKPPDESIYLKSEPRIKDLRFMASGLKNSPLQFQERLNMNAEDFIKHSMNADLKGSYFFNKKIVTNDRLFNDLNANQKIRGSKDLLIESTMSQKSVSKSIPTRRRQGVLGTTEDTAQNLNLFEEYCRTDRRKKAACSYFKKQEQEFVPRYQKQNENDTYNLQLNDINKYSSKDSLPSLKKSSKKSDNVENIFLNKRGGEIESQNFKLSNSIFM